MPPLSFPAALSCLCRTAAAVLWMACGVPPAAAAPRLTEFLAENADVIKDGDGDYSDYIEIHNPDDVPVNLAGYRLTDVAAQPSRWSFPTVILQPGEHLVVWASGKNRTDPKRPLHTNFRLNKAGGYLAFFPPEGAVALTEYAAYPPQVTDRSYGLYQPVLSTTVVEAGAATRYIVPSAPLPGWQNPEYPDQTWGTARSGLGFDLATSGLTYHTLFGAGGNLLDAMYEKNATVYLRQRFILAGRRNLCGLTLRMKYDDGFIAYLNGVRVASRFAPDTPAWNSSATALHDDEEAVVFEDIPIPEGLGPLRDGENVLAIHALNGSAENQDFLIVPALTLHSLDTTQPLRTGYFPTATPGTANPRADDGFTDGVHFSVERGFFETPFNLTLSTGTPGATIYYTLDSSEPAPRTARIYTGPIPISRTTVVRAIADADARHPSDVATSTYLFPADIIRQAAPAGYPTTWGRVDNGFGTLVPVPADYAMDQGVVNDPAYAAEMTRALRDGLPSLSLTTGREQLFAADGIYADGRSGSGEIPLSMEFIGAGWPGQTQLDAGGRIHGANAREHPKKPFRLYFRKRYGTDKLRYPLFGDSPVREFNQLILRPGGHDGWAVPFGNSSTLLAFHGTYVRDQFLRLTETEMGRLSPRGRYVHLYLNGLYWGIYDLHERANADFYASHLGGAPEDWDVVHHPTYVGENYSQVDGTGEAWEEVLRRADRGILTQSDYDGLSALVNVRDYIDSLIVRIWSGDYDWCGPIFLKNGDLEAEAGYFDNKNWYSARRSRGDPGGFLFHVWDAEMSMGSHLMLNRGFNGVPPWLSYYPPQRIAGLDSTRIGTRGSVAWPYAALRGWAPFRQQFGDRLQKHFFGDGRMTTERNLARLDSLTKQLEQPLAAESARWGDVNRLNPSNLALTRDTHWKPEIQWLRNTFITGRNALVLNQFRATGLFPGTPAPLVHPPGGTLSPGTAITLAQPEGGTAAIYYTMDGSDPAQYSDPAQRVVIDSGAPCTWWVPTASIGTSWRAPSGPSNPSAWNTGRNGLGYDLDTVFRPHFLTDVDAAMRGIHPSIYCRIEFEMESQSAIDSLTGLILAAQYDDGFIAAINGTVVQRVNAPAIESYQSSATAAHDDNAAILFAPFQLNPATVRAILKPGRNVLALQGLNQTRTSSDFLLTVRLIAESGTSLSPARSALLYDPARPPVPGGNTTLKARALAGGEWSALTEAAFFTGVRAARTNLVPAQIHYHPAPPDAVETAAGFLDDGEFEFIELLNLSGNTVDLTGCRFTNGIDFDFDAAAVRKVPPGGRLVIARNPAALTFRHGPGPVIAGAFANGTGLSNSGERLRLQAADGSTIFDLTYQDRAPWPSVADGSGPSLVLVNPLGLNNPENSAHWRASAAAAVPGWDDSTRFETWIGSAPSGANGPLDDPDGDGWPNLLEFASDTRPRDAASVPHFTIAPSEEGPVLAFTVNPSAGRVALFIEEAATPSGPWLPAAGLTEIQTASGPGTRQYRTGPATGIRRFYRLRAALP